MGERNRYTEAIILTVREQGENNRSVCAVSADMGIFHATLFGGPKSRLRSLVQPFNSGTMFIYDDESRHQKKVSDFDARNFHASLKENLYKTWAANLASEILMKTRCAGDDRSAYILLKAFLDGIDAGTEEQARIGTIRFLWRYITLLGVQPEICECIGCGRPLTDSQAKARAKPFFSPAQNGFFCNECRSFERESQDAFFEMSIGGLEYLEAINTMTPGQVRRIQLDPESMNDLKRFTFHLIEQAVGQTLLSLKSGAGIL